MPQLFANRASAHLAVGIAAGDTALTLETGAGNLMFPAPATSGDFFLATIIEGSNIEDIRVTARTGDTFGTIARAQESSTAYAFTTAAVVEMRISAQTLRSMQGTQVLSVASSATPTPDCSFDTFTVTALAAAATFQLPTGTPTNGQKMIIRIKDNNTARTLAWNAVFTPGGYPLPTITVVSKIMTLGFEYCTDNTLNKWRLIAVSQEA